MKRFIITTHMFFLGLISVVSLCAQENLDFNVIENEIKHNSEAVTSAQITYHALDYTSQFFPESMKQELAEQLQHFRQVYQNRINQTALDEEIEKYSDLGDNDLLERIQSREAALGEEPNEEVMVVTTMNGRIREEIFRDELHPKVQIWLYDGLNAYYVMEEQQTIQTGNWVADRWEKFFNFSVFGMGMERVFNPEYRISWNQDNNSLQVRKSMDNSGFMAEFSLLENKPAYWDVCTITQNGIPFMKHICQNFESHGDLFIPTVIKTQRWTGGSWKDLKLMSLISIETNVSVDEDYFSPPSPDSYTVQRISR